MRYRHYPIETPEHAFIGLLVFIETHRRVFHGQFGKLPRALEQDAFSMGGYCLDAPDELPGGACEFYSIGAEPDEWIVAQVKVSREA